MQEQYKLSKISIMSKNLNKNSHKVIKIIVTTFQSEIEWNIRKLNLNYKNKIIYIKSLSKLKINK